MKIVNINVDSTGWIPAHEGEALWSKTIILRCVGTCVPLRACKVNPVVVGNGVQTTSNTGTTRSRGSVGVIISVVNVGMVVEILIELMSYT
jgi:hypothetical protein